MRDVGAAERRLLLGGHVENGGRCVRCGIEQRLPSRRVAHEVGHRNSLAETHRLESAQITIRSLAPQEPQSVELQRIEHPLAHEPQHLLEIERRRDGACDVVDLGHLPIARACEEQSLGEDLAAVQVEEHRAHHRARGRTGDADDAVGGRQLGAHAERERDEVAGEDGDASGTCPRAPQG